MNKLFKLYFFQIGVLICLLWGISLTNLSYAEQPMEEKLNALTLCAKQESALIRLECYDNILRSEIILSKEIKPSQHSQIWHWIVEQESQRIDSSTDLLINNFDADDRILLTTPAIGHLPPRPILAFSCVGNITRMQIILFNPMNYNNTELKLISNSSVIDTNWFIRDGGFIFESSRGLLGIEQIKQLLTSNSLTLKSDEPMLNGLVFNLNKLDVSIKPLRKACHW